MPELSFGQIWNGPELPASANDWSKDGDVSELVEELAARRLPIADAQKQIQEFAAGLPADRAKDRLSMLVQGNGLGSDWTILCREDTSSGTIIGTRYGVPNIGTNAQQVHLRYLWPCTTDATNKTFVFCYLRNAGAQTFSVYNTFAGGPCLDGMVRRLGDNSLYRTVP